MEHRQPSMEDLHTEGMNRASPSPTSNDGEGNSPKNLDVLTKRRIQNREAQRAYRERKANRIQVLERSMGILQDMVTSWEKKYNDLKLKCDEQQAELNSLRLQCRNGEERSSIESDSTLKDFERNNVHLTNPVTSPITGIIKNSPSNGHVGLVASDVFEKIKKHMVSEPPSSSNTIPAINRSSVYPLTVLPTPGVSKPMSTHPNKGKARSIAPASNVTSTHNSLLFMLDSIANKNSASNSKHTTNGTDIPVLPPLKNNKDKGIDPLIRSTSAHSISSSTNKSP